MSKDLLLSICIPTYNRYNKLFPMLKQLLSSERKDFEIVIQDNCSTDGTLDIKKDLADERVRLIENPVNIGGIKNGFGALLDAKGKYCMICLDKDCVLGTQISAFMETLEVMPDINYGVCDLNTNTANENLIFMSQKECFDYFAYGGRHPSGMFWKTKLFKSCSILPKILNSNAVFGFFLDFVFAECSSKEGNGLFYRKPLLVTETPEESAKKKTLTYDKSQIFFFPKNRIYEFKVYLGQLQSLKLKNKTISWLKVFKRGLIVSTIGFKSVMQDSFHLEHYGIASRHVSFFELAIIAIRYTLSVLFTSRKKAFNKLFNGSVS